MAKLTNELIAEAVERGDGTGFCLICGAQVSNFEPNERNYRCEVCGEHAVCGAKELLAAWPLSRVDVGTRPRGADLRT